ncbi:hypothetical protein P692DRAFT_20756920 [Suillus brevipes Sb2]|nr:hypothetical protein P692DRAFT_20756920 [Suillus brevipes Sb2]
MITGGGYWNSAELKDCEVETGIVKKLQGHSQKISCIGIYISEDNMLLASGSWDSPVRIWNLETGRLVAGPFESDNWVGAVKSSIYVGKCLEVWDVRLQKLDARTGNRSESGGPKSMPIL